MRRIYQIIVTAALALMAGSLHAGGVDADSLRREVMVPLVLPDVNILAAADSITPADALDLNLSGTLKPFGTKGTTPSIYALPYSLTGSSHNWRNLWINTGVLAGAFVGTLAVLECLPEDATSWNRAELQSVPLGQRWRKHVLIEGPEWDHDKFIFNYVLHPYAGAVYYMTARSCGFNAWQSLLYGTIISNVGWEFGIEAFMERPSIQDLIITPVVGSFIGECFYKVKRGLVANNYCLGGSRLLGNIVAFLVDPVNEVVGLFTGNPARDEAAAQASGIHVSMMPVLSPQFKGITLAATF